MELKAVFKNDFPHSIKRNFLTHFLLFLNIKGSVLGGDAHSRWFIVS